MKELLLFLLIFPSFNALSQNDEYKTYSYTQFFKMIEKEQDTLFLLNDAIIQFDDKTDERFRFIVNPVTDSVYKPSRQIIIDKSIKLNNVHFRSIPRKSASKHEYLGAICNIYFKRNVTINNTVAFRIIKCKVDGVFSSQSSQVCDLNLNKLRPLVGSPYIFISRSEFSDFNLSKSCPDEAQTLLIETEIYKNKFNSKFSQIGFNLRLYNNSSLHFRENEINNTIGSTFIRSSSLLIIDFSNNNFNTNFVSFNILRVERGLTFSNNTFSSFVHFYIDKLDNQDYLEYSQIKNHFIPLRGFFFYFKNDETFSGRRFQEMNAKEQSQINQKYLDSVRYYNKSVFTRDMAVKGLYYNHYKNKYETETANEVYIEMKDMETRRLSVLYSQNPSFKTYFKWKVNQFLKLFSDYGTEPSKAIVVSLYVILIFALIYLFFPNSWDKRGKNRIMDRYRFFTTYMNRKAGIHEVYLDEQRPELLESEDFKNYMQKAGRTVPRFFMITAMPLYKWSISGTIFWASILRRIDIMRGTWDELPTSKRIWKSMLLIGAFIISIIYDIAIKILNALMLSINTFTTLGFGEIPIKGLPRYLAIIQGFIGWFMLTIFSVSLISQLLN